MVGKSKPDLIANTPAVGKAAKEKTKKAVEETLVKKKRRKPRRVKTV